MKDLPSVLFGVGVALVALIPWLLLPVAPTVAPASACGSQPPFGYPSVVLPGDSLLIVTPPAGSGQWKFWVNSNSSFPDSNSSFSAYELTQAQYDSYAPNETGLPGMYRGPPPYFSWSSGLGTSVAQTFSFGEIGTGLYYILVYNPGTLDTWINAAWTECGS